MAYTDGTFAAGGANSVQGGDPGKQSAGGIAGLFGAETSRARGPNAAAYNQQMDRFNSIGGAYEDLGNNYTQKGPQIHNQYQDQSRNAIDMNVGRQQSLADTLRDDQGEASKAQFQRDLNQSIDAQMSVANSTRGGAVAAAGARRAAAADAAHMRLQGSAEATRLGALEREQQQRTAAGLYGQVGGQLGQQYGIEQQSAVDQGRLDSTNMAQQDQMRLGYAGLGLQARGQGLAALNDYTSGSLGSQGLDLAKQNASAATGNMLVGTGAQIVGTAFGGPVGGMAAGAAANTATGGAGAGGGDSDILDRASFDTYGGSTDPNTKSDANAKQSIASMYGEPAAPARRQASLSDAIHGLRHLAAHLEGR